MIRKHLAERWGTSWAGIAANILFGGIELVVMRHFKDKATWRLIRQALMEERAPMLRPGELFLIHSLARHQTQCPGDFAEVGVFRGTSARLICEAKGDKRLHLFDTFAGLPPAGPADSAFRQGLYAADIGYVREKLARYPNVRIYQGLFPATASAVAGKQFAFVHLDVDLYDSTHQSLDFFYPRLAPCGMIMTHDYHTRGVRRAFDDYLQDKPERVIELHLAQGLLIKSPEGLEPPSDGASTFIAPAPGKPALN